MFTETELREALEHSATRADTLSERVVPARRRRVLLPLAAAAAVAALATGGAVVAGREGTTSRPSPTPTVQAAGTTTAPRIVTPQDAHVPVDVSSAVDLVQVTHDDHTYYTVGGNGDAQAGSETVEKFLGEKRLFELAIVDSAKFDPDRIPRTHPVQIAGTTGYYAKFKLFPLDANTGPGSDKYTAPWTIAFRSPQGKWVFVNLENGVDFDGVNDPDAIVAAYDALGVRFVSGETRLPFRTGYVPDGFALASVVLGYGESWTTLSQGDKSITIAVLHDRVHGDCAGDCGAVRYVGDYTVNVLSDGYASDTTQPRVLKDGTTVSAAAPHKTTDLEQRVLDGLQLAPGMTPTWSIADSLG